MMSASRPGLQRALHMIEPEVLRGILSHQLRHPGKRNAAVERTFDEQRRYGLKTGQAGRIREHVSISFAVKRPADIVG